MSTLRTTRLPSVPAADALPSPALTALSHQQRQALRALLSLLDQPGPRRAIGLFGPAGSGKTTLLATLRSGALRTPHNQRVICTTLDAARLSVGPAPWQQLILRVLDGLAALAGAPAVIHQLRAELDALAQHEANNDETATLAAAAFAHRFRSSFAGIIRDAVLSAGATFVVAIDHLDAAAASAAAQLMEASQYFLNGQGCSVLICADEARLTKALNDAGALARWLTARVALAHRDQAAAAAQHPDTTTLPPACVRLFGDVLGSDYYAIERAGAQWQAAAQALSYHQAGGHVIPVTAESLAKLCALKVISPMLFDAACLDPALLLHLERQAQTRGSASLALNGWSEVLARDPRLTRLFAGPPRLAGTHPSYLLAALRLIQTGSLEMPQALPAPSSPIQEAHVAQSASQPWRPALSNALSASLIAALIGFGADRLAKQITLAQPDAWLGEADLLRTGLGVGVELAGLALCLLLLLFAFKPADRLRGWALGLLTGGLASLLLDRLTLGAPANHLQIAALPLFSLAHAALLAGAVALIAALVSPRAR